VTKGRITLSILAGVLGFLGYVGFNQFYLEWFFLVPLLLACRDVGPRTAFFLGTVTGTVGHLGGFYWIPLPLIEFGGLPLPFAFLCLLLLALANGITFGIWAWILRRIHDNVGWSIGLMAPFVWVAVEYAYPFLFPVYLGASQFPIIYLLQIADVTGPLGLSFLVMLANGTVFETLTLRSAKPLAIAIPIFAIVILYGVLRVQAVEEQVRAAPKLTVALVQTGQSARERNANPQGFLLDHREMTLEMERNRTFDLIVWPEYVTTIELEPGATYLPRTVRGDIRAPVLFGCIAYSIEDGERRYYGSAILAGPEEKILGRYDKHKLVPFGEYVPFSDYLPSLSNLFPHTGNFLRGKSLDPFLLDPWRLSTTICYEALHTDLIREMMTQGPTPHLLVNLTNDSWYGNTHEPIQHLVLASLRSVENRRALVRVTNTGISAIIDPVGRIDPMTEPWTSATLMGEVPMLEGRTFYSVVGDWLGWFCLGIVLFAEGKFQRGRGILNKIFYLKKCDRVFP
jgi:apolipoprotein N-acyltransferase